MYVCLGSKFFYGLTCLRYTQREKDDPSISQFDSLFFCRRSSYDQIQFIRLYLSTPSRHHHRSVSVWVCVCRLGPRWNLGEQSFPFEYILKSISINGCLRFILELFRTTDDCGFLPELGVLFFLPSFFYDCAADAVRQRFDFYLL